MSPHWYSFGRDTSDSSENTATIPTSPPVAIATAGPSQDRASADEEDEPPPPLIKGRTWRKQKGQQQLVKQFYKRYELDWSKLRTWLKSKFPDLEFTEELDATRDFFVFHTTRELTKDEREAIGRLRNDYREE